MTSFFPPAASVVVQPPAGFNWPFATYPLTVFRNGTKYGAPVSTDFVPEKYINPNCYLNVYHVSTSGSDSNTGLGTYPGDFTHAFASINKAITVGNATSAPYMVLIYAGTYYRANGFSGPSGTVVPTQDAAFFAYGGAVTTGMFDNLTFTLNGTYTSCYSTARSNVWRVVDLLNSTAFGAHVDLTLAASASACNMTAGTWYDDGTNLYVHRADGTAVTSANTRAYLNVTASVYLDNTARNIYLNGLNFEGGATGALSCLPATTRTGNTIAVNCGFGYSGQLGAANAHNVSMDNTAGLAAFVACASYGGVDDAFNFHWDVAPSTAAQLYPLLINCTAKGHGVAPSQSVNGYTFHDGIVGIDIGGDYEYNFGGNVACILSAGTNRPTQCWCVGTKSAFSRGDVPLGGTFAPRDYWIDGMIGGTPCAMWLDGCYAGSATSDAQAAQSLLATGSAVMYTRNVTNAGGTSSGTITAY